MQDQPEEISVNSWSGASRRYPERPLLGVGAVVFHDGKLLLIQRGQEPLKGWWTVPGGLVETGEHLEAAVRRETLEETGLTVKPAGIAAVFERIMAADKHAIDAAHHEEHQRTTDADRAKKD